jgi:hypothetical protein
LPIRVVCTGSDPANTLVAALDGLPARVASENGVHEVHVELDAETSERLVTLFNSIGLWVSDRDEASCQVLFGDRSYTLLAVDGQPNDPTRFLLERTIQLQTALDTRIVIEQAKGVLAERLRLPIGEAFELLRRAARTSSQKIPRWPNRSSPRGRHQRPSGVSGKEPRHPSPETVGSPPRPGSRPPTKERGRDRGRG